MCHNHSHVKGTVLGTVLTEQCEVLIIGVDQHVTLEEQNGLKLVLPYCMMLSFTLLGGGKLSSSDYPQMVAHCMLAFAEAMNEFVSLHITQMP